MAVYIDIITGFLESGKTTFIQEMIEKNVLMEYQKTILIVCEEGYVEYKEEILAKHGIDLIVVQEHSELNDLFFQNIENEYSPEHIMVEYNGTWDIMALLCLKLPFTYHFRNVLFVSQSATFQNYLGNMASILQPHVLNSDIVLFNRDGDLNKQQKKALQKDIKRINNRTEVLFDDETMAGDIISRYFPAHEKYYKISRGTKIGILLLVISVFMPNLMLYRLYLLLQSVSTVFLGILIEAIPFVLFGAIISSVIQLFVPSEWILKKLSGKKYSSFLVAVLAGFFMPICDCGTVPIVSGLLKKEVSLPQTMTFWLASSAVNPIVLLSIYYAFPGQAYLVVLRSVTGILIALFTGLILKGSKLETKMVIRSIPSSQRIGSEILKLNYEGTLGKLEAVVKGARYEFFRVMKYLIIGALITSFLQTIVPQAGSSMLNSSVMLQLVIMIVAAAFMSTCSTSNAFIGRSFLRSFKVMPVMLYIVLGPMIDIKNMLMLTEIMKKRYLMLIAAIVSLIGYSLFLVLSQFAG